MKGIKIFKTKKLYIYPLVLIVLFCTLAPFFWIIISSISTTAELLSIPVHFIPRNPTFERYKRVFTSTDTQVMVFRRGLVNSFIVASGVSVLCLIIGTLAGYAFARLTFPRKDVTQQFFLFTNMLPPIVIIISVFFIFNKLKLLD